MSRTLNLVQGVLARGRQQQELGRTHEALTLLGRLAGFRGLPDDVAEEVQVRLAEMQLRRRRFARARRHLASALRHRPDSARYHYLMASAVAGDDRARPQRALDHYRRSLELDSDQPRCLCAYGQLALQLGQRAEGLQALRRAAELAPDDPDTVGRVAAGLRLAHRSHEAETLLRHALFRNRWDSRFDKLWSDFRFQQVRRQQQTTPEAEDRAAEAGPVLLPFVRPAAEGSTALGTWGQKVLRHDGPAAGSPPHPAILRRKRHAQ